MLPGAGPAELLWFRDEFSLPEKKHANTAAEFLTVFVCNVRFWTKKKTDYTFFFLFTKI